MRVITLRVLYTRMPYGSLLASVGFFSLYILVLIIHLDADLHPGRFKQ